MQRGLMFPLRLRCGTYRLLYNYDSFSDEFRLYYAKNRKFFVCIIVHLRFYNNQNNSTCEDNVKSVKYFLARKKFDV